MTDTSFNQFVIDDTQQVLKTVMKWPAPYAMYMGSMLKQKNGMYPVGPSEVGWLVQPALCEWMKEFSAETFEDYSAHFDSIKKRHPIMNELLRQFQVDLDYIQQMFQPGTILPDEQVFSLHMCLQRLVTQQFFLSAYPSTEHLAHINERTLKHLVQGIEKVFDKLEPYRPSKVARFFGKETLKQAPEVPALGETLSVILSVAKVWHLRQCLPYSRECYVDVPYCYLQHSAENSEYSEVMIHYLSEMNFGFELENFATRIHFASTLKRILTYLQKFQELSAGLPPTAELAQIPTVSTVDVSCIMTMPFRELIRWLAEVSTYIHETLLVLTKQNPYFASAMYGHTVIQVPLEWFSMACYQWAHAISTTEKLQTVESATQAIVESLGVLNSEIKERLEDDRYWELLKDIQAF